jgi:hypothetical protein
MQTAQLSLNKYQDPGENDMVKNRICGIILAFILVMSCAGVQGSSSNLLRLEGSGGWTQQITVPQGTTANLVVLAAKEGIGELNELSPDGCVHSYNYFFRRYDHLPFYADKPGRHVLSYTIDGIESNPVEIDVTGTYVPTVLPTPHVAAPVGAYASIGQESNYAMPTSQDRAGYL